MTGTHDGEYKGIPADGSTHRVGVGREGFRLADGMFAGYWCLERAGLMRQLTEEPVVPTLPQVPATNDTNSAITTRGDQDVESVKDEALRIMWRSRVTKGTSRTSGPYTVGFETYTADVDVFFFFVGLPDDRCQCPHMGYVPRGESQVHVRRWAAEEVYEAGDAYYAPPGHTPRSPSTRARELVESQPDRRARADDGGRRRGTWRRPGLPEPSRWLIGNSHGPDATATTRRRIATRAPRTGFKPARRVTCGARLGRDRPRAARQFPIERGDQTPRA